MRYFGQAIALLSLLSGLIAAEASAQSVYPSRPIRLVNPYAPGGLTDVMARIIGDQLGKQLGQPVVVEPKAGGGTSIAATAVARGLGLSLEVLHTDGSIWNMYAEPYHFTPGGFPVTKQLSFVAASQWPGLPCLNGFVGEGIG